jgi:hypothetical protein
VDTVGVSIRSAKLYSIRAAALFFFTCCLLAAQTAPRRVAIRCGRLIDGKSTTVRSNAVILIEGERIREVGTGLAIPAGARVIDLSGATVLPGLIDNHTLILLNRPTTGSASIEFACGSQGLACSRNHFFCPTLFVPKMKVQKGIFMRVFTSLFGQRAASASTIQIVRSFTRLREGVETVPSTVYFTPCAEVAVSAISPVGATSSSARSRSALSVSLKPPARTSVMTSGRESRAR